MHQYPFIFSDERTYRLKRHLLFWCCWLLFQGFIHSFSDNLPNVSYSQKLVISLIGSLFYLAAHLFMAYSFIYFVIPKLLLKGKYAATALFVILLFVATALISTLIGVYLLEYIKHLATGSIYAPPVRPDDARFYLPLAAGLRGATTVGGIAAAIKLMKHWHLKEQRNLQLQKENVSVQLQLLRAQVHPHFLFNTLNNIYSHTQNVSPTASRLVIGLSHMLRYMLYECNQPLVPLEKELTMLEQYISLEKIRYDNRLEVSVSLPAHSGQYYITPLLLLPFIENCFKHGTSQRLEQPWINLTITVKDDVLKMKVLNGKAEEETRDRTASGIGIANVKKRLELLYPQKHQLTITDEEDVFIVDLKLKLDTLPGPGIPPASLQNHLTYAE